MQEKTVSIILPTYNERENIALLIPKIELLFQKKQPYQLKEIIVVDDYSPDGTAVLCQELHKTYKNIVVLQKEKQGIGAALRWGYDHARGEIILSMDSDLSFSVTDIPILLDKIGKGNDLVLGCRHSVQGAGYETKKVSTAIKGVISGFGNKIIPLMLNIPIHDFSANFRAIRKEVWSSLLTTEKTNLLLLEMIVKVQRNGYKIAEVPVIFSERKFGVSKLNLSLESLRFAYRLLFYYW
ncbi:glycosyltransferase [Candidatus Woesearchaeota archaeon]|nr:glycosyltransferase [Candidatus Woesearchaeota archaeon]